MTRQGWAERKVVTATTGYHWNARRRKSTVILPALAAKLLLAEHRRAVRVVKAEIKRVKLDRHNYSVVTKAEMTKCLDCLLAALQRGRE